MSCQVISTGSKDGNAVLYHGAILVDCGVPASRIKPYQYDIQLVLLTHEHKDHINEGTLRWLAESRPTLRIGCCEWMLPLVQGFRNVDVYQVGQVYDYGAFSISPIKLYHDVPNCGYRIFKGKHKIIHATDTAHLDGITAKGYDLYAIEHNYDEETIEERIRQKEERGEYAYEKGAINSHLSEQKAKEFIFRNKGEHYQVVRLHETSII